MFYSKATEALDNVILVLVTLDPNNSQSGHAYVPIENFGILQVKNSRGAVLATS